MHEHYQHHRINNNYPQSKNMENDFTPKKTMFILVIVVGCFAVLWPKVFYPMLVGNVNQHLKPNELDKSNGCCYVLSETDVDTIKIMSELCKNIIKNQGLGDDNRMPLSGKQIVNICQNEVLNTCGIDISSVLQEQVRLGRTTKQILDEIRSLNGSLCFKYNFGVQPWKLGVPHVITLRNLTESVRQERPPHPHVRSEMLHPAFRERGRAIIPQRTTESQKEKKIIDGRPGPIPGMRPTIGGAGHVVPPSKQGTGSMGIIMPIYTIGIVIFFTYTLMKIIFKKHPDTDTIYSNIENETNRYRKDTFGDHRVVRDAGSCKLVVNAVSALLEEVDQEIEARRLSNVQDEHSGNLSNGNLVKKEEKPSVKVVGMETTESCEDGKKWQTANSSSVLPTKLDERTVAPVVTEPELTQEIYLDRVLPPKSRILVSDSATETEKNENDDDVAVVLAGKMTLSVISLENDEKLELKDEISGIIEKAIENIGKNEEKHDKTPLIKMKSSSEDSGSTVLSNQSSVIDLNEGHLNGVSPQNGNLNGDNESDEEVVEIVEEIYSEDDENEMNGNEN